MRILAGVSTDTPTRATAPTHTLIRMGEILPSLLRRGLVVRLFAARYAGLSLGAPCSSAELTSPRRLRTGCNPGQNQRKMAKGRLTGKRRTAWAAQRVANGFHRDSAMKSFPGLKILMVPGVVGVVVGLLTTRVRLILAIRIHRNPKVAICIRIIWGVKGSRATEVRATGANLRQVAIALARDVLSHQNHQRNRRKTRRAD